MERRILLAFVLAFLVLYGFQALFPPPPPPSPQPVADMPQASPDIRAEVLEPVDVDPVPPDDPEVTALIGDTEERTIVVDTETIRAVFTNRGGQVLSWRLKAYDDDVGQPIDLVPSDVPANEGRPFSLRLEDQALTERLDAALYRVEGAPAGRLDVRDGEATLTFEFQDAGGLDVRKAFRFEPDGYVVGVSVDVRRNGERLMPAIRWGPGLSDLGALSAGGSSLFAGYVQAPQGIYHRDGDVSRLAPGALLSQPAHEGRFRFVGIDDHYFISALVNPPTAARVEYRTVTLPGDEENARQLVAYSVRLEEPTDELRFFVGPKQFDILRAADGELVRAIHFGFFGFLAAPLLNSLNWIHGYVGNYGWSIVILTVLINLSLFYFRHKSVVSMRKMQEIQPQIKAIQERYKGLKITDPARQKMNTEVMNLYREKGVNPASGCLPMIMMMPVLIAFYSFLSVAIELRGAEFGLWIQDLSRPDPYFVVPILMGASMFWQQRITPTTVDPMQQRIMLIMPVMFTFFFLWFPSGLVIYWFTSNLWAIGQQYFTYWLIGPPVPAAPRPPAERKLKAAGSGRSAGATKPATDRPAKPAAEKRTKAG
jgi:YidC/Oxa1 family membrane protein insertase